MQLDSSFKIFSSFLFVPNSGAYYLADRFQSIFDSLESIRSIQETRNLRYDPHTFCFNPPPPTKGWLNRLWFWYSSPKTYHPRNCSEFLQIIESVKEVYLVTLAKAREFAQTSKDIDGHNRLMKDLKRMQEKLCDAEEGFDKLILSFQHQDSEFTQLQGVVNQLFQSCYLNLIETLEVAKSKDPFHRYKPTKLWQEDIQVLKKFNQQENGIDKSYHPHKIMAFIIAHREEWFEALGEREIMVLPREASKKVERRTKMKWSIGVYRSCQVYIHLRESLIPKDKVNYKSVKKSLRCDFAEVCVKQVTQDPDNAGREAYFYPLWNGYNHLIQTYDVAKITEPNENEGFVKKAYICTKLAALGNLEDYLSKLDVIECMKVLYDILRGLVVLHDQLDIAHRDLKAKNVVLDRVINPADGEQIIEATLIDPGFCGYEGEPNFSAKGSLETMAPEVKPFESYSLKATDMWSFACLAVQVYLQRPLPWKGLSFSAAQKDKIDVQTRYFKDLDNPLDPIQKLIFDCFADDPLARPTANQALKRFEEYLRESQPVIARIFMVPDRVPQGARGGIGRAGEL